MRILLDECVDQRLAASITGHEVRTVPQEGWASFKNGDLLKLAQARFDAFVTVDRNLSFQQQLTEFDIAVVVLRARTNRLLDLLPLVPALMRELPRAARGAVTWVDASKA